MAIHTQTEYSKRAQSKEDADAFAEATELYLRSAFWRLSEYGIADSSNALLSIADLLRSLICAKKYKNDYITQNIQQILISISLIIQDNTDDKCLQGLTWEWIGDSQLIIGSSTAVEHYKRADQDFEEVSDTLQRSWSMEPEFDQAYWAFIDFINYRNEDLELLDETEGLDFNKRINWKMEYIKNISN